MGEQQDRGTIKAEMGIWGAFIIEEMEGNTEGGGRENG